MNIKAIILKINNKITFKIIALIFGSMVIAYNTIDRSKNTNPNKELPISIYFTPWDNAEQAIILALNTARKSIHIQAYVWTSKPLTNALIAAKKRGVLIKILCDRNQVLTSQSSQIPTLVQYAIPVKLEVKYQNAHNKVIIIDNNTVNAQVITGSYNFSYSAQHRNSENLLIIQDLKITQSYYENWQKHSNDAIMY